MLPQLFLVTLFAHACTSMLLFCPNTCKYGNQTFCGHIPCPLPRCDVPLVLTDGDCCEHCPTPTSLDSRALPEPQTTICPANCTQGGKHYCFPVPCPMPPCVDPVKTPGECCQHCPDGPNCERRGVVIKQGESHNFGDEQCTCRFGGHLGAIECVLV